MRSALLAAPLALLAGCLASPKRSYTEAPFEPPLEFAAAADALARDPEPSLERWWEQLGGPALAAAVEEAFEHNRDLGAAAARVELALAEARAAGASLLPSAQLAADAGRRRQNFIGLPLPGGGDVLSSTSTSIGLSLDLAWEADLWGRLGAQDRAAHAEVRAGLADLSAAHLSLAGQVARAWFALAEARLQAGLASETVDSYESNLEVLRERFRIGRTHALDVHLLENQLAVARALLEQRREAAGRAVRRLELLLGRAGEGGEAGAGELPAPPPPLPAGLPADLAWRRPDLVAAQERLAALDWRLAAARADLLPRLRLTGSAGRRTSELADLLDSSFDVWSLAADIVQPLFEGGRLRARVAAADARTRAALEELAMSFLGALSDVESALVAEEHLARQEAHLEDAAREAARARELAEERYFAGLVDVLFLLDAQRRDLAGQGELIAVRRRRLETRVDLHLALGGGFGAEPPPRLEAHLARGAPELAPPDAAGARMGDPPR